MNTANKFLPAGILVCILSLLSPTVLTADQYFYDDNGRLQRSILGDVEITYQYDNGGNLLQTTYASTLSVSQQLQQLYIAYLGRPADSAGLDYWTNQIELGNISLEQIRVNIVNEQPEYLENYGQLDFPELTDRVYQNLFNREADAAGRDYWIGQLEAGKVAADQLIIAFVNGASEMDKVTLANKLFIAECFTSNEDAYSAEDIAGFLNEANSDSLTTICPGS
jgi:hypothetical protein